MLNKDITLDWLKVTSCIRHSEIQTTRKKFDENEKERTLNRKKRGKRKSGLCL